MCISVSKIYRYKRGSLSISVTYRSAHRHEKQMCVLTQKTIWSKPPTLHNLHFFLKSSACWETGSKQLWGRWRWGWWRWWWTSEKWTAGPSIYHSTSLQLHLHNQSHPLLIDVRIIELSLGFSCFSSSLPLTVVIVLYFPLTPFTTKDILMCIYVNILPDCCHRDRDANSCTRHDRTVAWTVACPG